jgi:elongation factor P
MSSKREIEAPQEGAAMIDVNDLRKGTTFILEGQIYEVLEYQHHKPGRGNAFIRTKLRNLRTGAIIDKTFLSGDRVQDIRVENREVQFLYWDSDLYYMMDTQTYEQIPVPAERLGEAVNFLKEGITLILREYEGEPLGVELPVTVDLRVVEAEPGVKGDTASGADKWVVVETGYRLRVPLFVNEGDIVRIDTRTGEYVTRVS